MTRAHRATIFTEQAKVLVNHAHPGGQHVLRLRAPECAKRAVAGQFVHLRCAVDIPLRRPLSIMRVSAREGWIELLFKVVGHGLGALSNASPDDLMDCLGPIGRGFAPDESRSRAVLIGGGVGIPPLVFLAEQIRQEGNALQPIAFFGSELPFPFELAESQLPVGGVAASATHTLNLLEQWKIPGRLASAAGLPGCHSGYVTDLARDWLSTLDRDELDQCAVFACGPTPMLKATQSLARDFALPSHLCLEEFMACAVGGCAGCTVLLQTDAGPAMQRVCVDGPVFDGYQVYPA